MPVRPIGGLVAAVMDLAEVDRIVADRLRPVVQAVADAEAVGEDARQMVIRRDAKLNQASTDATAAISEASTLQQIAASYAAALPASLLAGETKTVTVPLSRDIGSSTYSVGYALQGGAGLLSQVVIESVVAQAPKAVTLRIKNTGLGALVNLATSYAHVVAAREA